MDVPLGRRIMVVSDLLLTPEATAPRQALTGELAQALDTWDGPGILIIAGNLFDLTGCDDPLGAAGRAIDAHPALARAFLRFLQVDERRILRQRGTHEPEVIAAGVRVDPDTSDVVASLAAAGVEHLGAVDLHVQTGTGTGWSGSSRASTPTAAPGRRDPTADAKPGVGHAGRAATGAPSAQDSPEDAPWLDGRRPAVRPVGPHPLRGVPHPLPAVRPLRLVAPGAVRRRPACCAWRSPRGCSATWAAACPPGPCATPTPPTSTTSWWWPSASPSWCSPSWPWCSAC